MRPSRLAAVIGLMAAAACAFIACSAYEEASPEPAPADGGNADSTSPIDGGSQSDALSDGGAGGFCKTSDAAFCQDFDDGVLQGRWTYINNAKPGITLEISKDVSRSPESSLHSVIDRAAIEPSVDDCAYANAGRSLVELGQRQNISFSFDLWFGDKSGTPVTSGLVWYGALVMSDECRFLFGVDNTDCFAQQQFPTDAGLASDGTNAGLPLPLAGTWAHLELRASTDPMDPKWSYYVNGIRCGEEKAVTANCQGPHVFDAVPGIYCVNQGTGKVEVFIDNVEVR